MPLLNVTAVVMNQYLDVFHRAYKEAVRTFLPSTLQIGRAAPGDADSAAVCVGRGTASIRRSGSACGLTRESDIGVGLKSNPKPSQTAWLPTVCCSCTTESAAGICIESEWNKLERAGVGRLNRRFWAPAEGPSTAGLKADAGPWSWLTRQVCKQRPSPSHHRKIPARSRTSPKQFVTRCTWGPARGFVLHWAAN